MSDGFRLDRYLTRIGLHGPVAPDIATLAAIHAAHPHAIPFEALDPFLGRPVRLDIASLQAKLVDSRRGGYCFEQNGLLKAALEAIGFRVTGLTGRVRWRSRPDDPLGPRTHMLLRVDLPDGPHLADVGFGACVLDAPLRLETGVEQRTTMGTYRLSETNGQYSMSVKRQDGWRTMYIFDLTPQIQSDYDLGNWFSATNPTAPFMSTLMLERVGHGQRAKLVDTRLTVEASDGVVMSERAVHDATDMAQVLDRIFGLTSPAPAEDLFARLIEPGRP